jgi:hypothetical protein
MIAVIELGWVPAVMNLYLGTADWGDLDDALNHSLLIANRNQPARSNQFPSQVIVSNRNRVQLD